MMTTNDLPNEAKQLVELAKGRIYEDFYSLHPGNKELLSQLDFNNYIVGQIAMQSILITNLNQMVTLVLKKMGALKDEGNEQADAAKTSEGSNGTPANDV